MGKSAISHFDPPSLEVRLLALELGLRRSSSLSEVAPPADGVPGELGVAGWLALCRCGRNADQATRRPLLFCVRRLSPADQVFTLFAAVDIMTRHQLYCKATSRTHTSSSQCHGAYHECTEQMNCDNQ